MDVHDLLAVVIILFSLTWGLLITLGLHIGRLQKSKMDAPESGIQVLNVQNFGEQAVVDGKTIKDPVYRILAVGTKRSDAIRPATDFK